MNCLRCGQAGRWAANCPQSSSPTSRTPGVKRPATSSTTEAMAMTTPLDERALLIFQDSGGAERPDCVMLDPGASAFLSGYGRVKNTEAGDDEQARLFLSRDLFDVNPLGARAVQFALHHRMFWNKKLMSVFLSMANEVRLVLKTGKP